MVHNFWVSGPHSPWCGVWLTPGHTFLLQHVLSYKFRRSGSNRFGVGRGSAKILWTLCPVPFSTRSLWSIYTTGRRYSVPALLCGCSADLNLDRHMSVVSSASFYWLRQLRRVRRSFDDESAAILVHAFVASRVD